MVVIPEDLSEPIRTVLQRMADSGQSEAKAMAECICNALADCDRLPPEMVLAMAGEFVGWGAAIVDAASGKPAGRNETLKQERWVFTGPELTTPENCQRNDEFATGPVLWGPPDDESQLPRTESRTELGVLIQRNGKATNRWDDGTAGVPAEIVKMAEAEESYATVDGKATPADNWRDVLCTVGGWFVRFADGTS